MPFHGNLPLRISIVKKNLLSKVNGSGVDSETSQRAGSWILGRLLSHRGPRKTKKGHMEKQKEPDKNGKNDERKNAIKERGGRFKMSGGVLPAIRSGKRLSID